MKSIFHNDASENMVKNDFLEGVIWEIFLLFEMKNMHIFSLKNDAVTKCLSKSRLTSKFSIN